MRVLILGAAGMLGRKLTKRLLRDSALGTMCLLAGWTWPNPEAWGLELFQAELRT